jgi:hypothetical protein
MIACLPSNFGTPHDGLGQIIRCYYLRRWRIVVHRLPVDLGIVGFMAHLVCDRVVIVERVWSEQE